MALYDPVSDGSFKDDFNSGRKLHASNPGVILPWVIQLLNTAESCSKRMSGAWSNASEVKQLLTSDFPGFKEQTASFTILPVTLIISSTQ